MVGCVGCSLTVASLPGVTLQSLAATIPTTASAAISLQASDVAQLLENEPLTEPASPALESQFPEPSLQDFNDTRNNINDDINSNGAGVVNIQTGIQESIPSGFDESDAAKLRRYRLGPGDFILITVERFPELTFQGPVNPEGSIVLPLVGIQELEGLTLAEAQAKIQLAYDQFVIEPIVNLALLTQRPVEVTVIGEVEQPGFYPLSSTRVADAIFTAGGVTGKGDMRRIQVSRTLNDGEVIQQTLDFYTPLVAGTPIPSLRLEDGDVVAVLPLEELEDENYDRQLVSVSNLAQDTIQVRVLSYAAGGANTLQLRNGSVLRDALNGVPLDQANLRRAALIRLDPETGMPVQTNINVKDILRGDPSGQLPLQDDDVLVIGRNLLARLSFAINTITQPFRDTLGFILFFQNIGDAFD
ncbi:MAG: polysaccharide biosynthesis/export family protein [Cyanobacteria bacterium P01_H01_bin.121]